MSRCGGEWLALFSLALMTSCGGVVRPTPRALRARVERREALRAAAEAMLERSCLSVLESHPALRGAVELEATVEQTGATRGVLISGDALDGELAPQLETCLVTAMRGWRGEPGTLITIHPVFQTGRFLLSRRDVADRLDRGRIRDAIRSHMDEVRGCAVPGVSGGVVVSFVISAEGTAQQVHTAENDLVPFGAAADRVAACLLNAARDWTFPQPDAGPVLVRYPFVFDTP